MRIRMAPQLTQDQGGEMYRRRFVAVISGALAAPRLVLGQPSAMHRVAWLSLPSKVGAEVNFGSFVAGMAALGYQDGKNLILDARYGDDSREMLERRALEAASLKPAVFVTHGPGLAIVRKFAEETPVVFLYSGNPVMLGVAKSFGRPGGHYTGVTLMSHELAGKRIELLVEMFPKVRRLAVLTNPEHAGDAEEFEATRAAAARFHLEVSHYRVTNAVEVERALAAVAAAGAEAMLMNPDSLFTRQGGAIARFSIGHRIPAVSGWASFADVGNLISYGPNQRESYGRLAYYTDRVLRGTKPADLPIEFPSKLELVVNLKAARLLGVTVPQAVLLRADRLIE